MRARFGVVGAFSTTKGTKVHEGKLEVRFQLRNSRSFASLRMTSKESIRFQCFAEGDKFNRRIYPTTTAVCFGAGFPARRLSACWTARWAALIPPAVVGTGPFGLGFAKKHRSM